jgi:branched-chain amino acid transport system ATP-binding protein
VPEPVVTSPLLEVRDLDTGYGRTRVLRGVSMTVEAGARVGIIGPNGHGKTTLMRAISGLLRPWAGDIALAGSSIAGASPAAIVGAGLVHVPQGNGLFPDMSVEENLRLGAYQRRLRAGHRETMEEVFALFPRLAERRRQLCRTLSGGERQMVSIGVGLMARPKLLMLDEPTLGLSPKLKEELSQAIVTISAAGMPLLLVEQDVKFLLALTTRFYLLHEGRMEREFAAGDALDNREIMDMYFGLA